MNTKSPLNLAVVHYAINRSVQLDCKELASSSWVWLASNKNWSYQGYGPWIHPTFSEYNYEQLDWKQEFPYHLVSKTSRLTNSECWMIHLEWPLANAKKNLQPNFRATVLDTKRYPLKRLHISEDVVCIGSQLRYAGDVITPTPLRIDVGLNRWA